MPDFLQFKEKLMDIYTKLSHLENQLTLLVDVTEGNGSVETTGKALSSTLLNLLQQVQSIQQEITSAEKRKQNS
jgi:hypothetical protein